MPKTEDLSAVGLEESQECSKCRQAKPLPDFRRQSHRRNGRDTICRSCRAAHDRRVKESRFGPLPEPDGSREWMEAVWTRAAIIRKERRQG